MSIVIRNDEKMIAGAEVKEVVGVVGGAVEVNVEIADDGSRGERGVKSLEICLKKRKVS